MYTIKQEPIPTISTREFFAVSILQGLLSAQPIQFQFASEHGRKSVTRAIKLADELISQLQNTSNNPETESES